MKRSLQAPRSLQSSTSRSDTYPYVLTSVSGPVTVRQPKHQSVVQRGAHGTKS